MTTPICRYLQFVKDLQEACRDNLAFIKEKAVKAVYDLLRSNPEQEALLLSTLVDKLGDPSRKIASNVRVMKPFPCYCLRFRNSDLWMHEAVTATSLLNVNPGSDPRDCPASPDME